MKKNQNTKTIVNKNGGIILANRRIAKSLQSISPVDLTSRMRLPTITYPLRIKKTRTAEYEDQPRSSFILEGRKTADDVWPMTTVCAASPRTASSVRSCFDCSTISLWYFLSACATSPDKLKMNDRKDFFLHSGTRSTRSWFHQLFRSETRSYPQPVRRSLVYRPFPELG